MAFIDENGRRIPTPNPFMPASDGGSGAPAPTSYPGGGSVPDFGAGAGAGGSAGVPTAPPVPNWGDIIANSPYVIAARALGDQQLAALRAQMGANAARALINLGDKSLVGQFGNLNLPGGTAGLVKAANKAGTSVLAQLGYQHGLNQEGIPAALAGRGFFRSGETGYQLGQESRAYGQRQYSARQSTLDYLNGLYNNFLNAQFGIQQNELGAQFQAYQAALANAAAYVNPGGAPEASPAASNPDTVNTVTGGFSGPGSALKFISVAPPWTTGL